MPVLAPVAPRAGAPGEVLGEGGAEGLAVSRTRLGVKPGQVTECQDQVGDEVVAPVEHRPEPHRVGRVHRVGEDLHQEDRRRPPPDRGERPRRRDEDEVPGKMRVL